ncbi:hypothetical protein AB1N83_002949 [Pleurotus pulmonarius]
MYCIYRIPFRRITVSTISPLTRGVTFFALPNSVVCTETNGESALPVLPSLPWRPICPIGATEANDHAHDSLAFYVWTRLGLIPIGYEALPR